MITLLLQYLNCIHRSALHKMRKILYVYILHLEKNKFNKFGIVKFVNMFVHYIFKTIYIITILLTSYESLRIFRCLLICTYITTNK
jgi:hypothetical protein